MDSGLDDGRQLVFCLDFAFTFSLFHLTAETSFTIKILTDTSSFAKKTL